MDDRRFGRPCSAVWPTVGLLLAVTSPGDVLAAPFVHVPLAGFVNAIRSTPFIVRLVAMIPLTRLLVGTSIGLGAAIVPLRPPPAPFFMQIA